MTKDLSKQTATNWTHRLRRTALWFLFALVLLIPKTLSLRKRPGVWDLLRFGVAVLGVFLFAMQGGSAGFYLLGLLLTGSEQVSLPLGRLKPRSSDQTSPLQSVLVPEHSAADDALALIRMTMSVSASRATGP